MLPWPAPINQFPNKKKIGKFHLDEQRVILQVREKSHWTISVYTSFQLFVVQEPLKAMYILDISHHLVEMGEEGAVETAAEGRGRQARSPGHDGEQWRRWGALEEGRWPNGSFQKDGRMGDDARGTEEKTALQGHGRWGNHAWRVKCSLHLALTGEPSSYLFSTHPLQQQKVTTKLKKVTNQRN